MLSDFQLLFLKGFFQMLVLGLALLDFHDVLFEVIQGSQVLLDDDLGNLLVGRWLRVGVGDVLVVTGNLYLVFGAIVTRLSHLSDSCQDLLHSCHRVVSRDWYKLDSDG